MIPDRASRTATKGENGILETLLDRSWWREKREWLRSRLTGHALFVQPHRRLLLLHSTPLFFLLRRSPPPPHCSHVSREDSTNTVIFGPARKRLLQVPPACKEKPWALEKSLKRRSQQLSFSAGIPKFSYRRWELQLPYTSAMACTPAFPGFLSFPCDFYPLRHFSLCRRWEPGTLLSRRPSPFL